MPKSQNQKLKLLYIRDYLAQNTDEKHPASTAQLLSCLRSKGIEAERKSLYSDIHALEEYGMEIHHIRGRDGGYYASGGSFTLTELKLLIDAVLSSRFLTSRQSVELVQKLAALSTTHESALLRRELVFAGRLKSQSEEGFANAELLHEAIDGNSQIAFRYYDFGPDGKKHFRNRDYTASPYALVWDDENYYLVAHSSRHGLTHYRVDKMAEIRLTGEPRVFTEESRAFDPALYSREVFGMFRGQRQRVKLRFENSLAGVVIDRFGRDQMLVPQGPDHFVMTVEISMSPNFLGWLTSLAGRATIVFPPEAVQTYRDFCRKALEALDAPPDPKNSKE